MEVEEVVYVFFFFQAEDGIRDADVTGVKTCALPIFEQFGRVEMGVQHQHLVVCQPVGGAGGVAIGPGQGDGEREQRDHGASQALMTASPVAGRSTKMPLSKWRVGWTRLVSRVQAMPRPKSIHSPVPVKPVCPIVSSEQAWPPDQPANLRSQPQVRCEYCGVRIASSIIGEKLPVSTP